VMAHYALLLVAIVVSFAKGKIACGVIGVLVPFVAWVSAVRLARPGSPWARRRYGDRRPAKDERGRTRDARFDRRWRAKVRRLQDLVAGPLGSSS
jgi:hypothetical protein